MTPPESISISSSRSDRMPPNQRDHNSELLSREPGFLSALFACCSSTSWNLTGHIVTMPVPLFEHKPLISGSLNPEALLRPTTALSDPVALLGFMPVEAIRSSAESDASAWSLGLARGGVGPREEDVRYLRGTWQVDQGHQLGRQVAVVLAWRVTRCAIRLRCAGIGCRRTVPGPCRGFLTSSWRASGASSGAPVPRSSWLLVPE